MLWRVTALLIFDDLSVIPSTASEALERKEMFYFTGKKCRKGHLSLRYASTKHCKMCSKIREKVRWADSRSRDKCLDKQRRWRKENFEYFQSYMKEWRSKNQEKVNTARRKWAIKERSRNKSYRVGLKLKNELTRTIRRNGKYIDLIGTYDPLQDPPEISIDEEKINKWISNGAQPSDSVSSLMKTKGIEVK